MTDALAVGRSRPSATVGAVPVARWLPPGRLRSLQLCLGALWLLDGVLQLQPVLFTPAFGHGVIAPGAAGNPAVLAHSISWAGHFIGAHPVATNTPFALIQLLVGLGIAWRPTLKVALAASVLWSLGVWSIGEGLGGILNGTVSPMAGAPGAALLYGLLAVLLWPPRTDAPSPAFPAAGAVGALPARVTWSVLWGGLAALSLFGANRSRDGLPAMLSAMSAGQPGWLATLDRHGSSALSGRGLAFAVGLALVLAALAVAVHLGPRATRVAVVVAVAVALFFWVVGQNFGGMLAGGATDPDTGPLLVVLAVAFWPVVSRSAPARSGAVGEPAS